MQSYTQLAPEFFKNILTPADMDIINTTVANPAVIPTIQAIIDYNKTQIMNNITKKVVKAFNDLGITCFGQTVKACQTKIGEFLDNNPECRDFDSRRCFNKILYKLACLYHQKPQNQVQQNQPIQNQPIQNQSSIGFTFG